MTPDLTIVKIGGKVTEDGRLLASFLTEFSRLEGNKILVHGGGKTAGRVMEKMGIEPKMINGRRITDLESLDVVTMVYAGLINKKIVAGLQNNQCNAMGLTGADLDSITAEKRKVKDIDYGYAGDITKVNSGVISNFLHQGIVPVFCSITHGAGGQLLNTNADTIASTLAKSMTSEGYRVKLLLCFELEGVLKHQDNEEIYSTISTEEYKKGVENGQLAEGIIPKLQNAFEAIKNGVSEVRILNVQKINDPVAGTLIKSGI